MPDSNTSIFLIINRLTLAGGSMDMLSMAFHLAARYDVTVVYGEKEQDEKDTPLSLSYPGIRYVKIPALQRSGMPLYDAISFYQLQKLIRRHKPHIVHTTGFKPGLVGRLAAKACGVPVVVHTYHGHVFHSYYNKYISSFIILTERWLARWCTNSLIAVSPQQAYDLSHTYRIAPARNIHTIFIGIDISGSRLAVSQHNSLRSLYHVPHSHTIVAIIGRLVPIKNHSLFIEMIRRVQPLCPQVSYFIIGDGFCKKELQHMLDKKGIRWQEGARHSNATVFFTSWIEDIGSALADIDIVVLTSLNEGTPVSLIEAQLMGIPVVATNVGGVRDTIVDGETGFLCDLTRTDDLVEKVTRLIKDNNLRQWMGNKGKAFAARRFSKQKEVAAVEQLYLACLLAKQNKQK